MILGSHNSWSYLPIKQWWLRPFRFMYQCQEETITSQISNWDCRFLELRVSFDKKKQIQFSNGRANFTGDVYSRLADLLQLAMVSNRRIYILVVLEKRVHKQSINLFRQFCKNIHQNYASKSKKFILLGAYDKKTGNKLYYFGSEKHKVNNVSLRHSSVGKNWLLRLYPKAFAALYNMDLITKFKEEHWSTLNRDEDVIIMDYINYIQD